MIKENIKKLESDVMQLQLENRELDNRVTKLEEKKGGEKDE